MSRCSVYKSRFARRLWPGGENEGPTRERGRTTPPHGGRENYRYMDVRHTDRPIVGEYTRDIEYTIEILKQLYLIQLCSLIDLLFSHGGSILTFSPSSRWESMSC